jgi:CRP-like cAMP-binding protein
MSRKKLEQYIQSLLPLSAEKATHLSNSFKKLETGKNHFLLKENNVSKETYFLESGFVRAFTIDVDGNEVTTNIFSAPSFVNDFASFFKQLPTRENFQTVTECAFWKMSFEDVQHNFHEVPEFREFGRMIMVTNYSQLNNRMISMIKDTAETRYLNLLNQHLDIFQNVPLKIIASYLGIADTSLSRIRKELTNK